ncbi:aromatic amino acid transaminase [Mucisphaera sp.]|uniref:amino acid aminotransferase n=1 Tax=Mucisphaera sp. TaxID=2913024 RepID=UPI003D0B961E
MFENIQPAPPDPILGLTDAYKADTNPHKINLGVGVFQDASGKTPILASVKAAEKALLETEQTKSYLPIDGSPAYAAAVKRLLFPEAGPILTDRRAASLHTPGGTGALRVAGEYLRAHHPEANLWLSAPTWPNHTPIFEAARLHLQTYPYYDPTAQRLDLDAMLDAIDQARPGDAVLLHGCCHNPTGVDPTPDQWKAIAKKLADKKLLPILDFAYQGFGEGLQQDTNGLHTLAEHNPEILICTSYSKNFGLYNERVGALTVVAASEKAVKAVLSQIKTVVRRMYSNPPGHGAAIVSTILSDTGLRSQWERELAAMRDRIHQMRQRLSHGLSDRKVQLSPQGNDFLTHQKGMFSFSGLNKEQVEKLRSEHAIYIVGSGRINVAGITENNVDRLCDAIAAVNA